MNDRSDSYVLGYSEAESRRLVAQSAAYEEFTEDVLRRAGLAPGMRVLDIGCGAGDVSLLAARIVGDTGEVIGVDRSADSLAFAQRRADAERALHIRFLEADLNSLELGESFDALIGRFVLMYIPQPATILHRLLRLVRPGGIVTFQEMDMVPSRSAPDSELWRECRDRILQTFERGGVDIGMGMKLHALFKAAGLPAPQMNLHARVFGAGDPAGVQGLVDLIASLLPMMERLGVATAQEIGMDTLASRLQSDLDASDGVVALPSLIGAWAQKL